MIRVRQFPIWQALFDPEEEPTMTIGKFIGWSCALVAWEPPVVATIGTHATQIESVNQNDVWTFFEF
jgi:hypothetical protein